MYKANTIADATGLRYNEINNTKIDACIDNAEIINNNKQERGEGKIDIVVKKNQTDA